MARSGFKTQFYFDKQAVIDAVGKAKAGVMGRQGAITRKIMRNSIRKHKGHAPAGQPPYSHQGDLKKIEFAFDTETASVVVGPAKFKDGNTPEIQDKGGTVKLKGILNRKGQFIPLYAMSVKGRLGAIKSGKVTTKSAKVAPRPFSQPALVKAAPYFAREWKGKVKK